MEQRTRRMVGWISALAVGLGLLTACGGASQALPVYWNAPSFTLTDQDGQRVSTGDLAGRVWLVNFIYTTCPDVCPTELMPKMRKVQELVKADASLAGKVQLVSISVDPANDTPPVLKAYGQLFDADPAMWRFLVGTEQETVDLLQTGFKVGLAQRHSHEPGSDEHSDINHSTRFALVDAQGRVRGTPLSSDETAEQFVEDMRNLVNEESGRK